MQKILYVEDDLSLIDGLQYTLEASGYMVDNAKTVKEALALFRKNTYDLLLLDVTLPDGTGFDVCKAVRNSSTVPIIFLTASDQEISIVRGLDMGADDYITKPFTIGEVIARVRAVLRRTQAPQPQVTYNMPKAQYEPDINFKTMRIDRNAKACYINGQPVALSRKEFDLLLFFLTHRERIHSREEIMTQVWGNVEVTDRAVDTNIARLRKKIAPYGDNIVTRLGFGYGFKAALE